MRLYATLYCCLGAALLLTSAPLSAEEAEPAVECELANLASEARAEEADDAAEDPQAERVHPTHKQTKLIDVNHGDLEQTKLRSFCLKPDGTILAACGGKSGEVRLFNPAGEYLDRWELVVDPEAINVGADGYVYIAGEGKLLRLSAYGKVVHQADAPHVTDALTKRDEIRETIIKQQQKNVESYQRMSERYTERLVQLKEKLTTLEEKQEEVPKLLTQQIASAERMVQQWESMIERLGSQELSEEDIEQRVMASIRSSMAIASISEADGQVFMATREPAGYGFCVWKMTPEFTGGEVIAKGLSGCCGQMDVQACKNGVYVAENSRHRVYHVSSTGEELGEWGQGAREGLEGFGSCCNPMNVAFGPEDSVYTAESGTGRIKRYSPSGELIELVGKVDVVPGCKKVSIAVDKSGDRVYMMDITRHHIVLMERLAAGEEPSYSEIRTVEAVVPSEEGADPLDGLRAVEGIFTY